MAISSASSHFIVILYGILLLVMDSKQSDESSRWSLWWSYHGISGPKMWGTMNSDWYMCNKGRNQSPIDIEPSVLLYDPSLKHVVFEGETIVGTLINTGMDLTLQVNETASNLMNITLGPLSYKYRIAQIKVHFGSWNGVGSEHSVKEHFFDGEIHILAYNADVYSNFTQAQTAPRGVAVIAAFLQVGNQGSAAFNIISQSSEMVIYKGQQIRVKELNILSLLPSIENYVTYEGSLTQPGCYESVTWMILNRPITVSQEQLNSLRNLRQRDHNYPQAYMADNRRPIQPLNRRPVRTNINFKNGCSMEKDLKYQFNARLNVRK